MSAPGADDNPISSHTAPDALERALAAAFFEQTGADSILETEEDTAEAASADTDLIFLLKPPSSPLSPGSITPVPLPAKRPVNGSGWLVGIVVGVLVGLWMLPPVRYTLGSQLRFALAQDSLPWLRSLETQPSLNEVARLDVAAATLPDDYLLQVGRATVFVESGGVRAAPIVSVGHADDAKDVTDHTLVRLTRVAHDFPIAPGAQAHLARYMMVDRVRIQRAELAIEGVRGQG